jgi:3-hydroxyisobutyrate dehydrogenase-like beta-hydroxyacid dehydrogenase
MHIGFIGLGAMGKAMVETLLEKGHAVTVWNRSPGPAAELAGRGDMVAAAMPALEALAAKVWPMGEDPVRANAVKIAGNLMIVAAVEAMGEATALGAAHGVPAGDLLDVLTSTIFAAPVYKIYGAMIAEGRYHPPGFAADLALKDVRLAQAAGDEKGLALPLADLVESGLEALLAGEGETPDLAGLAEVSRGRVEGR